PRAVKARADISGRLVERHGGDPSPPHLEQVVDSATESELEVDRLPVHPYRALRAPRARLAGRGRESDVLDQLTDPDLTGAGSHPDGGRLVCGPLLEALLEEARGPRGGLRPVEAADELGGQGLLGLHRVRLLRADRPELLLGRQAQELAVC